MKIFFASSSSFGNIVLSEFIKDNKKPVALITLPDRKRDRGQSTKPLPVKELAIKHNIDTLEAENKQAFHEVIKEKKPDVVIVVGLGIIILPQTLELSKFINIHPSLLPLYRGPAPIQGAIIDKQKKSGVTIIKMNEKIDQGPIIAKREVPFHSKINYVEAEKILAVHGAELLLENITPFLEEEIVLENQNDDEATYTRIITKNDGKINWQESAEDIECKIRAYNPWPGTHTSLGDKNIKIIEASTQEQTGDGPFGEPGKIYLGTNNTIAVQTGKNFLIVEKIQIEGKKEVPMIDFLHGNMNLIGKTFN